jgi:hypothetical protein
MGSPETVIDRLLRATNDHDLDALVECFAEDYLNETPAHPARGFRGRHQVRTNWQRIFEFVPDIEARVLRSAVDNDTVWTEWEMRGTRLDGSAHVMCGVIVFGIVDDTAAWARFYLEPAEEGVATVNEFLSDQVHAS